VAFREPPFRERARTDVGGANRWGCRLPTYDDIVLNEQMLKKRVTAMGLMDLRGANDMAVYHHLAGSDSVARELAWRRSDADSDDDEPSVPYRAQWDPLLGISPAGRARVEAAVAAEARATAAVAAAAAAVVNGGAATTAEREAAHAAVRQTQLSILISLVVCPCLRQRLKGLWSDGVEATKEPKSRRDGGTCLVARERIDTFLESRLP
jgi:hypothetical protein